MQGIVVVKKEEGWSSFDVVKKIKRIFNTSKVGHLGTLDPMAEGVLPVAIGKATKLFDYYLKKTKTYIADFEFGYETDTLDREGEVINNCNKIPTPQEIRNVLIEFIGKTMQTPPKFSAVKINGKRAYSLARENKEFEIKPKEIEIRKLELLEQLSNSKFRILIDCSAGTYIRSLCRDIAYKLNSCATMTKLERVRSGNFTLENARTVSEIEKNPQEKVISITEALSHLPKINLDEKYFEKLKNGVKITLNKDAELSTVFVGNILFGLGEIKNKSLVLYSRFYEGEE